MRTRGKSVASNSSGEIFESTSVSGGTQKCSLQLQLPGSSCESVLLRFLISRLIHSSDIAYYGINLNQSVILTRIGYAKGATPWQTLYNTAIGNIIVQAAVSVSPSQLQILACR